MTKAEIYIGLNDAFTKEQRFETSKYVSVLKNVCINYGVPFSFSVAEGGYIHDSGEYTQETSLVLSLIDIDDKTVGEIAKDLCVFFRQESVLVTRSVVESYSVKAIEPGEELP